MDKAEAEYILTIKEDPYTKIILKQNYKAAVKNAHPDCGGSHEQMVRVNEAFTYLLSYFKYQDYVSLSSKSTYAATPNYDYQEKAKEQEKRRKEAYARKVDEEMRKAAEKMKEAAASADSSTDFSKAYEDFTYWVSQKGWTSAQQWATVEKVFEEIKIIQDKDNINQQEETPQENPRDVEEEKSYIGYLALLLRLFFFVFYISMFICVGSWDFILNFGTFHFMDYWAGDFLSFVFCTIALIMSIFNLVTGFCTDWIVGVIYLIKDAVKKDI